MWEIMQCPLPGPLSVREQYFKETSGVKLLKKTVLSKYILVLICSQKYFLTFSFIMFDIF